MTAHLCRFRAGGAQRSQDIADAVSELGAMRPSVMEKLEGWMRRRLRCFLWKQWKLSRVRFKELRKRGVGKDLAAEAVGSAHGPWRLSNSPALAIALNNDYFRSLGLPSLTT